MINKENIPKGHQIDFTEKINLKDLHGIEAAYGHSPFWLYAAPNTEIANFISEAFNVFSKTGMTPEELAKKVDNQSLIDNYDLKKQIEQLQQERDELIKLQKENFGDATTTHLKLSKYVKSLTTQQEENK